MPDRYIKDESGREKVIDSVELALRFGKHREKKDYIGIVSCIILVVLFALGVWSVVSMTMANNKDAIVRFEKNLQWQERQEAELQRLLGK